MLHQLRLLDVVAVAKLLPLPWSLDSTWHQAKPLFLVALKLLLPLPKLHLPKRLQLLSQLKAPATLLKKQLLQFLRNPMRTPTSKNCVCIL